MKQSAGLLYFSTAWMLFVSVSSYARTLSGVVLDPQKLVISRAHVVVVCEGKSTVSRTDSRGHFEISGLKSTNNCSIAVSHPGFESFQTLANGEDEITIILKLRSINEIVEVSDDKNRLRHPLVSVSLSDSELERISNDSNELIRYAKLLAGVSSSNDAIYVDGLPSTTLPPAQMIARITINADPFSAEYADGDQTRIEILTKGVSRKFHFDLGGGGLGAGGHDMLRSNLRSDSRSSNLGISAPLPSIPVAMVAHLTLSSKSEDAPILAALSSNVSGAMTNALVTNISRIGSVDLFYSASETFHAHLSFYESRASGSNIGAGGLTLPEAAVRSSLMARETRATINKQARALIYRGGFVMNATSSEVHANNDSIGISVLGSLVAGGSPVRDGISRHSSWISKHVLESTSPAPLVTGVTFSHSEDSRQNNPNAFGSLVFEDAQQYESARAGQGTGTLFLTKGNAVARYANTSASPFVQKELIHRERFLIAGGLRADYQRGFKTYVSPRLSAAMEYRGLVFRAGVGIFVRNISQNVLITEIGKDPLHSQEYILKNVYFGTVPSLQGENDVEIHSQVASNLTRSTELMQKASIEKDMGSFASSIEFTRSLDRRLLGSRRVADGSGWLDLLESNRSANRNRIHAQLRYKWGPHMIAGHYEWARSKDDTDGAFSFPSRQDDLRAEWARSSGVSPHSVTFVGSFKLPKMVSLSLTDSWRSSAPYNITTGLDPSGDRLFTDRGGRPRNSGNGTSYNSLGAYIYRRTSLPKPAARLIKRTYLNVGVQTDNLLNNKNYISFGSIASSPLLGQPLAALPSRSIRIWMNLQ